jgi:hypothetical protein
MLLNDQINNQPLSVGFNLSLKLGYLIRNYDKKGLSEDDYINLYNKTMELASVYDKREIERNMENENLKKLISEKDKEIMDIINIHNRELIDISMEFKELQRKFESIKNIEKKELKKKEESKIKHEQKLNEELKKKNEEDDEELKKKKFTTKKLRKKEKKLKILDLSNELHLKNLELIDFKNKIENDKIEFELLSNKLNSLSETNNKLMARINDKDLLTNLLNNQLKEYNTTLKKKDKEIKKLKKINEFTSKELKKYFDCLIPKNNTGNVFKCYVCVEDKDILHLHIKCRICINSYVCINCCLDSILIDELNVLKKCLSCKSNNLTSNFHIYEHMKMNSVLTSFLIFIEENLELGYSDIESSSENE